MRSLLKKVFKQIEFRHDYRRFYNLNQINRRFVLNWKNRYPILEEKTSTTSFDAHYIYHTAWAARLLQENNITQHVDISSSTYFASIISAFIPVKFFNYRLTELNLSNLETGRADLLKLQFEDNSLASLSCMHVVEHIGLGRYGDPLNPDGDIIAIRGLSRVVKPGGLLLFVVPVGKPKICFNAHRIYDPQKVLTYFSPMELCEFSCVLDTGEFRRKVDPSICDIQNYACGMYYLRKPFNKFA